MKPWFLIAPIAPLLATVLLMAPAYSAQPAAPAGRAAAAPPAVSGPPTEIFVAAFAGDSQAAIVASLGSFEKENNVKITWVAGSAAANVAKAMAQRARPEFTVVMTEDFGQSQGAKNGLWASLDPAIVTNLGRVLPQARYAQDQGVGIALTATGLLYNTEKLRARGLPPPRRFSDLTKPEYCGNVGIMSMPQSHTLKAMVVLGGQNYGDLKKGVETMSAIGRCASSLAGTSGDLDQRVQSGEYWVAITGAHVASGLSGAGMPVKFVYPEEGAAIQITSAILVKNGPHPEIGMKLINRWLSPEAQTILVNRISYGPVNNTVKVPAHLVEKNFLAYGANLPKLKRLDGLKVSEFQERWTREFNQALGR